MSRWLNNTIYVIIAIVSMGCTMQGIKWQTNKNKNKDKNNMNNSGNYSLY